MPISKIVGEEILFYIEIKVPEIVDMGVGRGHLSY